MVIYAENSVDNIKSGKHIGQDIEKSLLSRQQTITSVVSEVEYVVMILTGGVLEDESCLRNLQIVLDEKKELLFIMSKVNDWVFEASDTEIKANNNTAKTIRKMLNGHEVMSYRPKGGNRNYEHESMMNEMMMERLGVATVVEEVGTTMVNDQENGVVNTEEEEEKVSVNVDDDERKED